MATIEADLRTLLLAEASITALVGSTGVYNGRVPQSKGNIDRIELHVTDTEEFPSLDGGTGLLRYVDFDCDCKGRTYGRAKAIANALRVYIDDFSGATGGTQTIGAILYEGGESDDVDDNRDGSDTHTYITTIPIQVQFNPV